MLTILYLVLVAGGMSLAHYRVDDQRNLIEREEQTDLIHEDLVECPVCDESEHWLPTLEECPIVNRNNKRFKRCKWGTYINELCGNKIDCYRGPGDRCTEKMDFDIYDQRCAPGYYCNKAMQICTGIGYTIDSKEQYYVNPIRYQLRSRRNF